MPCEYNYKPTSLQLSVSDDLVAIAGTSQTNATTAAITISYGIDCADIGAFLLAMNFSASADLVTSDLNEFLSFPSQ